MKNRSIYVWKSVDLGLYFPGFAVAVADSFGEACKIAANSLERESDRVALERQLLTTQPEIIPISEDWGFVHSGCD